MLTMISEICGNKIIQTGAVAWVISQVIKTILHLIVNKKIVWERLVGDGGMPSSHSATVTSVAVATGFTAGWGSPVFGVAVFMIELFEKMGAGNLTPEQTLKEFVGHTPMQVFAGGILGIIVALVMHM